jgi:hypothetical protein
LKNAGALEHMTMTSLVSFARRQNGNGSVDSICTQCYQTIASANDASKLAILEQSHVCNLHEEFKQKLVDFRQESVV